MSDNLVRTPAKELEILRLGLRRVAEAANRQGADIPIPDRNIPPRVERGWNRLCSDLIDFIEATGHSIREG